MDYVCFRHPFTACVSGPSGSGKTTFVRQLILNANELIFPAPQKIIFCYSEWQDAYNDLPCEFHEGVIDIKTLKEDKHILKLVLMDDLMTQTKKNDLDVFFCQGSHHWNMSIIHITQNVFYPGMRTARINSTYLVLFKSVSDKLGIKTLSNQMFPGKQKLFMEAFNDATAKPFTYLLLDFHPLTDERIRLRTQIFSHPIVYTI
jgi:hypothetical protein